MRAALVILNWNTRSYLQKWLPALLRSCEGLDASVVVADSGSTDGSMEMLEAEFPLVRRLPLGANYGFTGGYNRALSQLDAEYFVLINSDIDVPQGWLRPLLEWMDSHPECGICGPKIKQMQDRSRFEYAGAAGGLMDFFGYPYCRGRVLGKTAVDSGQYDSPAEVSWVSGACLMIRRSLWERLGGLEEGFFAHMEEIDLCWRAAAAGWKVCAVGSSEVYHLGGGTLPQSSPRKLFLNYRNNLLLLDRNLPRRNRARIAVRYILDIFAAIAYLCTLNISAFNAVVKAHGSFWKMRTGGRDDTVNILSNSLLALQYFKKI